MLDRQAEVRLHEAGQLKAGLVPLGSERLDDVFGLPFGTASTNVFWSNSCAVCTATNSSA
jgi:hypothetical protein